MNEGVVNAFKKIRDESHAKPGTINLDLTFTVRRDDEPMSKAIKGMTLDMLVKIGEIKAETLRKIKERLGGINGARE